MICSFTLYLKPLEIGERIKKFINYDTLSPVLKDSGLSSNEIKKIVISNFLTKDKIIEDKNYSLKISSIDEEIIIKLFRIFFLKKLDNSVIKIGNINFIILNIYTTNKYSKQLDENIFNIENNYSNILTVKFITPFFLKVGDRLISTLEPKYIIKNIEKKLAKSSVKEWEKYILNSETLNRIEIYNAENSKLIKINNEVNGYIGEIQYLLNCSEEEIYKINFLFNFAFFSGIGYMCEKGYGQVEII